MPAEEEHIELPAEVDKKCIVCKQVIDLEATKCHHCSTFQTWRRHLALGTVIVSLTVAIISITGLIVPPLKKAFHQPKSNIDVSLQGVGPIKPRGGQIMGDLWTGFSYMLSLQLLYSNTGDKPGIVTGGSIVLESTGKQVALSKFSFSGEKHEIKPGGPKTVGVMIALRPTVKDNFPSQLLPGENGELLNATNPDLPSKLGPLTISGGTVIINIVRFDGTKKDLTLQIEPTDIRFNEH